MNFVISEHHHYTICYFEAIKGNFSFLSRFILLSSNFFIWSFVLGLIPIPYLRLALDMLTLFNMGSPLAFFNEGTAVDSESRLLFRRELGLFFLLLPL
jgi:hypothetical protein